MENKSIRELEEVIKKASNQENEDFLAAKRELEKRRNRKEEDNAENNLVFPEKPIEEIKKQSIIRSLSSIVLFIAIFYLFFDWDFRFILILAGVLLIHELGHYLAMRIFNYKNLGIFFIPIIGAFASGSKDTISQKQEIFVLLSGPLPGIIIGLILYYFGLQDNNELLLLASNIFIVLNLFNLLPIMPLDGGRLLKSLFFENKEILSNIFIVISILILGIFSIYTKSYFLLIVPFFLIMRLVAQSQIKNLRENVQNKGISLNKTYNELSDREYWLIRDQIGIHIKNYQNVITPKSYSISEKENKIIQQVKAILQKKATKDLGIVGKIIITILWLAAFIAPVIIIAAYYIQLGISI